MGPIAFEHKDGEVFLGRDFTRSRAYSESAAQRIDREIKHLVMNAYERARTILAENMELLKTLAEELLVKESLGYDEMEVLVLAAGVAPRPAKPKGTSPIHAATTETPTV